MATRKQTTRNTFHTPSTTDAGPLALILEDMRDQFRVFGEGLTALSEKMDAGFAGLNQRMDSLERRMGVLESRMDRLEHRQLALEAAVTQHSVEIRELRAEVGFIRAALERKAQAEDVRRLEARVTELERRLGA